MYFLCVHGPTRLPKEAGEHPHESPPVMIRPLYVLAAGAIFAGYFGVTFGGGPHAFLGFMNPEGAFHLYLESSTIVVDHNAHAGGGLWLMYVSSAVAIAGIGLAWVRYGDAPTADPDKAALGKLWKIWNAKYYVDEIYDRMVVQPLHRIGEICFATDRNGVDGLVWFVSAVPRGVGAGLRLLQNGVLQSYALGMVIGVAALMIIWRWLEAGGA
jgi:NADH-quinone oxidoreductase subunit L